MPESSVQLRKPYIVSCPQCGADSIYDANINPYRPFCCKRCKLIDLGAWSSESYRLAQSPDGSENTDQPPATFDNHE